MSIFRKKKDVDMTTGSIPGHLIRFALPLLLGNLFQQLYNTVDSWVVGNYVSNEAFSAVGTISPIVNLFISFFSGLSVGAGVVVSQYYGARKDHKVSEAVHGGFLLVLSLGIVLSVLGMGLSPLLLRLMNTPPEVFAEANTYMRIYCSGLLFLVTYNMAAAILRAVGDTTRPFYYLVATALINIALDLLFVLRFHMGVAGVAYATIIAEAVSMILAMVSLMREKGSIRFRFRELFRPKKDILRSIVRIGLPSGLQLGITAFSNVFVQSYINHFGTDVMGGWTCCTKIERVAQMPVQSLNMSLTTFVGQNIGNGNTERAKKGVKAGFRIGFAVVATVTAISCIFAPQLAAFFNSKKEVVEAGALMIRVLMPFFIINLWINSHAGALKGAGDARSVMYMILSGYVGFRQIYLYIMSHYISNTMIPIVLGGPVGWLFTMVLITVYYRKNVDRVFEAAAAKHRPRS